MNVLNEALGNDGFLHTVTYKGKTYQVKYLDQVGKQEFSEWVYKSYLRQAKLEFEADITTAEEFKDIKESIRSTYRVGGYSFNSPLVLEKLKTIEGLIKLYEICLVDKSIPLLLAFADDQCRDDLVAEMTHILRECLPTEKLDALRVGVGSDSV